MMKYLLFLFCIPIGLSAQIFAGGSGSGYQQFTLAGADTCRSFFTGSLASGHAFASFDNPFNCGFSRGDSSSGAIFGQLNSTFNCIEFRGSLGSGSTNNTFVSPFQCPQFFASPSISDGFAARSFSESNAGACYLLTLPIEASPLFVKLEQNQAKLSWMTFMEEFNAGFHIQKSLDGIDWYTIGWVNAEGFSNTERSYEFYDPSVSSTTQYYRYVQEDFDGSIYISNVVSLSIDGPNEPLDFLTIYPNPLKVGAPLNIRSFIEDDFQAVLNIVNALGQLVYSEQIHLSTQFNHTKIHLNSLPAGQYYCTFYSPRSDQYFYQKLIIIN